MSSHALMQGHGFYNRHAWMQEAGIAAALPALARAAGAVPVGSPVVVADYGSSQGRNSLRPMQVAIEALRARAADLPITVVHVDQAGNDFSSLFALLNDSPDSYLHTHAETYAGAIGRSFFDPVLPPGSVTLGWSSFATMWLTRAPPEAGGHVFAGLAPPDVRELLVEQAASDWRCFLAARGSELRQGGRLVVLVAGPAEGASKSSAQLLQTVAQALRQLVADGRLTEGARARAFIPTLPRLAAHLHAPFANGPFAGMVLEDAQDWVDFPDSAWERYRHDNDLAALADAYLGFFQATFQPSLLHSMEPLDSPSQRQSIADALATAIRRAIADAPEPWAQIPLHAVVLRRV